MSVLNVVAYSLFSPCGIIKYIKNTNEQQTHYLDPLLFRVRTDMITGTVEFRKKKTGMKMGQTANVGPLMQFSEPTAFSEKN